MSSQFPPFQLYYANDSLCSFMVRYTIAICQTAGGAPPMDIKENLIDIHGEREQLSEHFLTTINPKGQVPVFLLRNGTPIPDSVQITHTLAGTNPSLMPSSHIQKIVYNLGRLHTLPYFTLSFGGRPAASVPLGTIDEMKRLLTTDISDEYRKALEGKLQAAEKADIPSLLSPEAVKQGEAEVRAFFDSILPDLKSGQWFFGLKKPSAFDAHLVPFLVRLQDVERDQIVPEPLKEYADRAKKTQEWKSVMGELKSTMTPG